MLTFTRMQRSGLLVILMLTTSEAIETKNKIKDHEMSMKFYDSAKGLKGKVWMGVFGENEIDYQMVPRQIKYFLSEK